jgi:hypothetical protein
MLTKKPSAAANLVQIQIAQTASAAQTSSALA